MHDRVEFPRSLDTIEEDGILTVSAAEPAKQLHAHTGEAVPQCLATLGCGINRSTHNRVAEAPKIDV